MYPNTLPQVSGEVFLTGSGLVNDLVFNEKFDLSEPASFVLVDDAESRVALEVYFRRPDRPPRSPHGIAPATPMPAASRPSQTHSRWSLAHNTRRAQHSPRPGLQAGAFWRERRMSGGRSKWLIWLGLLLIFVAIIWAVWVHQLPRDSQNDEATYGQFILAIIGSLTSVLATFKNKSSQPSLDKVADDLAKAVQAQWKNEATERKLIVPAPRIPLHWKVSELPVSAGIDAALSGSKASAPLPPLPRLKGVTRKTALSGGRRELFSLYGGLPTGRIVLLGEPGAGKTSAGIMLILTPLSIGFNCLRRKAYRHLYPFY